MRTVEASRVKKTLLISSWAPPMAGGPTNLYTLFRYFDPSSYVILTSQAEAAGAVISPETWLSSKYYYYDGPKPLEPNTEQIIPQASRRPNKNVFESEKLHLKRLFFSLFKQLATTVRVVRVAKKLIAKEQIDTVLVVTGDASCIFASIFISLLSQVRLLAFFFDIQIYPIRILGKILEPWLFRRASIVCFTNDATDDFYRQKYGAAFHSKVVPNSIAAEDYRPKPYTAAAPFRIVFTGHIYWAQLQSVLNLVTAMKQLSDLNLSLELWIIRPPEILLKAVAGNSRVQIFYGERTQMPEIQSQADLLFLPLAWDTPHPEIISTASPAKLTDYLAAGRPLLVHAPTNSFVAKYARLHGLGLVVDENSPTRLAEVIRNYFSDPSESVNYIKRGMNCFNENHNGKKNSAMLRNLIDRENTI